MRRLLQLTTLAALLASLAMGQTNASRVEKAFQNGGHIQMDLSAGDYEVRAGAGDKIVVSMTARDQSQLRNAKAELKVVEKLAHLTTSGPHNDFHVTIEVPPETHMAIHLSAGDLRVRGIAGDKDISSHAGDMDIEVVAPQDYGRVDASVKAGDLNAPAFGVSTGGLFRSFHRTGRGKYSLHAQLGAGDLNLR